MSYDVLQMVDNQFKPMVHGGAKHKQSGVFRPRGPATEARTKQERHGRAGGSKRSVSTAWTPRGHRVGTDQHERG